MSQPRGSIPGWGRPNRNAVLFGLTNSEANHGEDAVEVEVVFFNEVAVFVEHPVSSRSYSIVAAVAPFVRLDQIVVGIFRLRILVQIHVGMRGRASQPHTPIWVSAICTVREISRCCPRRTLTAFRKRAGFLSITHKLGSEDEAELDICEACETSPHDGVSRRRVFCTCQVAPEPSEFGEI